MRRKYPTDKKDREWEWIEKHLKVSYGKGRKNTINGRYKMSCTTHSGVVYHAAMEGCV